MFGSLLSTKSSLISTLTQTDESDCSENVALSLQSIMNGSPSCASELRTFSYKCFKKNFEACRDLTKMALKFKKFPQKSNWMNNVHMTTEKIQISADINTTAQTRICWDHWAVGEDIKTRATINWIIEPLSKLRIYSNGSWPSVSQQLHTGMFWLMIEKKQSRQQKSSRLRLSWVPIMEVDKWSLWKEN